MKLYIINSDYIMYNDKSYYCSIASIIKYFTQIVFVIYVPLNYVHFTFKWILQTPRKLWTVVEVNCFDTID